MINWFNLLGLIFNTVGGIYIIKVTYNPSEIEKGNPISFNPKAKEGYLKIKVGWSKLGRGVAFGVGLTVLGFILQGIGLFF